MLYKINKKNSESKKINTILNWLRESIFQITSKTESVVTKVPGLRVFRKNEPSEPTSYLHEPSICLVVQGTKWVILGKDKYVMNPSNFLINSLDLPVIARIIEAEKEKPYMSLTLNIDTKELADLILEFDFSNKNLNRQNSGMTTAQVTLPLLMCFQRLLSLNDEPEKIPIFVPIIKRELFCYILLSEQGARLRQLVRKSSSTHKIAKTIEWLKAHYTENFSIDELSAKVHMSTSSFHHHFKRLTTMSPLQYQKWLRLNEARRLMLTENLDVTSAAFRVGYESLSQFSREYRRFFGNPPSQDIKNLRLE